MTQAVKTHDLGNDWYLNLHADGTATIRNCEKGQRLDLPRESVETLRAICRDAGGNAPAA